MLANRTSKWTLGTVLLIVALLAVSWFFLISPRRADATELRDQRVAADQQADLLRIQLRQLQDQFADLDSRRKELAAVRTQLPVQADMPRLLRDIEGYADSANVGLEALIPATPVVVDASGAAGQPAQPGTPVPVGPQLISIPLSIEIEGSYAEAALFVRYIQAKMTRALLIDGVEVAEAEDVSAAPVDSTATGTTGGSPDATPAPAPSAEPSSTEPDQVTVKISSQIFVLTDTTAAAAAPAAAGAGTVTR